MITMIFDNDLQFQIFFCLINNPKGLFRNEICFKLGKSRTTTYDNIKILLNRKIGQFPYIKTYPKKTKKKGRPKILFYIPKRIIKLFDNILPTIKVNNEILKTK